MKIEHTAFPVTDPVAVANWYVANLGLRIVRQMGAPTYTHFLSDQSGGIIEIYNNPRVAVPDYSAMDSLLLHVAFEVEDMEGERGRLLEAGCRAEDEITALPSGDVVAMLRDPWGLALQLVKRAQRMS
jgi:catechol 2,3-dioxygenase-like lactoylglutathione lyase family enzyme